MHDDPTPALASRARGAAHARATRAARLGRHPFAIAVTAMFATLVGCLRPSPPQLTPRSLTATGAAALGMQMQLDLMAYNPNRISYTVRSLRARVTVSGRDMGVVEQAPNITLPARQSVPVVAQLVVPWGQLPGLMLQGLFTPTVPYHLDGDVTVSGPAGIAFTVHFAMDGTLPREMLMQTPLNTLQQFPLFPFLPAPAPAP